MDAVDQPPVNELPQVRAGTAARDGEVLHHVVGAKRFGGEKQQRVDFRHRPADAPACGHLAPSSDEETSNRFESVFRHGNSFQ